MSNAPGGVAAVMKSPVNGGHGSVKSGAVATTDRDVPSSAGFASLLGSLDAGGTEGSPDSTVADGANPCPPGDGQIANVAPFQSVPTALLAQAQAEVTGERNEGSAVAGTDTVQLGAHASSEKGVSASRVFNRPESVLLSAQQVQPSSKRESAAFGQSSAVMLQPGIVEKPGMAAAASASMQTPFNGHNSRPDAIPNATQWAKILVQAIVAAGDNQGISSSKKDAISRPTTPSFDLASVTPAGQQNPVSPVQPDTGPTVADLSASSPDTFVAEQVSYWVSRDVQNAQMRLDGLGTESVEVNISLRGNEAQIDFRTDQPEMRQSIEDATAHLTNLLSREGLVLTGVSVGTASQEGQGSPHRKNLPGSRQVKLEVAVPGSEEDISRASRPSGKTIDLFV